MEKPYPIEHLIHQLNFNYAYALDLISDVDEKDMTHTPAKGLENHPSFTIGHIITAYGLSIKYLGGDYNIKKEWDALFRRNGPGDPRLPETNSIVYPSKKELIQELKTQHTTLVNYLKKASADTLFNEKEWRFSSYFPKTIDLLYFMCITHYAMHINQLACWRRAMDLPSSLSRLS